MLGRKALPMRDHCFYQEISQYLFKILCKQVKWLIEEPARILKDTELLLSLKFCLNLGFFCFAFILVYKVIKAEPMLGRAVTLKKKR